jgi:hypothetical protein
MKSMHILLRGVLSFHQEFTFNLLLLMDPMYKKIIARTYFQYAVVWKKKTKNPKQYTLALYSIINYVNFCSIVLLIDIFFKLNSFVEIVFKFKLAIFLVMFALFYFVNNTILQKIIIEGKMIKEYELNCDKRKKAGFAVITYIILSVSLLFSLAKVIFILRHQ